MIEQPVDFGFYIVSYNLVVGVLLILASGKIASVLRPLGSKIVRYLGIAVSTFGIAVAALSGSVLVFVHLLRFGVE